MRGPDERSDFLFSYLSPEERVPADHPLRPIRRIVDAALARLTTAMVNGTPPWGCLRRCPAGA